MTNPKIERVKEQIAKTKEIIADYQAKLRELEKQKIELENLAVIAMFRKEKLDEDEFSMLLHSIRKEENESTEQPYSELMISDEPKEEGDSDDV